MELTLNTAYRVIYKPLDEVGVRESTCRERQIDSVWIKTRGGKCTGSGHPLSGKRAQTNRQPQQNTPDSQPGRDPLPGSRHWKALHTHPSEETAQDRGKAQSTNPPKHWKQRARSNQAIESDTQRVLKLLSDSELRTGFKATDGLVAPSTSSHPVEAVKAAIKAAPQASTIGLQRIVPRDPNAKLA